MCVSGCSAANILKEKIQTNGPNLVSSTWVLAFMRMSLTRLNSVFGQHTPSSVPLDRTMYTPRTAKRTHEQLKEHDTDPKDLIWPPNCPDLSPVF